MIFVAKHYINSDCSAQKKTVHVTRDSELVRLGQGGYEPER